MSHLRWAEISADPGLDGEAAVCFEVWVLRDLYSDIIGKLQYFSG